MTVLILFVLVLILGYYGYDTRQRLIKLANYVDSANQEISTGFFADRTRITELELREKAKRKK
jgi:hypothetical protein